MAVRVEQRGNRRHRWLENEAKCHRAARASKDVLPDTLEFLCRNAVPNQASNDQANQQHDSQTRQQDLILRCGLGHCTACFVCARQSFNARRRGRPPSAGVQPAEGGRGIVNLPAAFAFFPTPDRW
jgi:hypothetical protein